MCHSCHRSPFQGMLCKWVHEKRGHGSARLLLFLVACMSALGVHTTGGTARAVVRSHRALHSHRGRTRFGSWIKLFFTVRVGRESATRCSAEELLLNWTGWEAAAVQAGVEGA